MSLRLLVVVLAGAVSALLIACGGGDGNSGSNGGSSEGGAEADFEMRTVGSSSVDFAFEPDSIELTAGQEVTMRFVNDSAQPHSFKIDGVIDTGAVKIGDSATFTFTPDEDSTIFYCTLHGPATMSGEIILN